MAFAKYVEARLQLLECVEGTGNVPLIEKTEKDVVDTIKLKLGSSKQLDLPQALAVLEKIKGSGQLSTANKNLLIECIRNGTDIGLKELNAGAEPAKPGAETQQEGAEPAKPGAKPIVSKNQVHDHMENYLLETEWQRMSHTQDNFLKLDILTRAILRCGGCFFSEPQWAALVSLLGLVGVDVKNDTDLFWLNKLKVLHAAQKPKAVEKENLVFEYPADPSDLPEPWLSLAFREGKLLKCPFPAEEVKWLKKLVHCRRMPGKSSPQGLSPATPMCRGLSPAGIMGGLSPAQEAPPQWFMEWGMRMWQQYQSSGQMPNRFPPCGPGDNPSESSARMPAIQGGDNPHAGSSAPCKLSWVGSPPRRALTDAGKPAAAGSEAAGGTSTALQVGQQSLAKLESSSQLSADAASGSAGAATPPPGPGRRTEAGDSDGRALAIVSARNQFLGQGAQPGSAGSRGLPGLLAETQEMLSAKAGNGAEGEAEAEAGEAQEEKEEDTPGGCKSRKRKIGAKPKAKSKAKAGAEPKAKSKSKGGAKPTAVTAPMPKDASSLKFPGTKKRKPIHYGKCTVYTDVKTSMWRLKKKSADRVFVHFKFSKEPKEVWASIVLELRLLG
jgi:hypothetical protein